MVIKNSAPKKTGIRNSDSKDKPMKELDFEVFVRGAMATGKPPKAITAPKAKRAKQGRATVDKGKK